MGHKYNEKNVSCLHRVLPSSSSWVSPSEKESIFFLSLFLAAISVVWTGEYYL